MGALIFSQWPWLRAYSRTQFSQDATAAVVVSVLLVPQSLAYAMLAGLPPELGLYASIWPLIMYALLGSSRTLSVGPVAITSLMSAAAIANVVNAGLSDAVSAAVMLSLLTGGVLLLMRLFRFGFLANFLSHSVTAGFISASALIIILSQLKHFTGISIAGDGAWLMLQGVIAGLPFIHTMTFIVGVCALLLLVLAKVFERKLGSTGKYNSSIKFWLRLAPVGIVLLSLYLAWQFQWGDKAIALVGHIPKGLPVLMLPTLNWALVEALFIPALMVAMITYIESVSVASALAAKRRETVNPQAELLGLGAANIASGLSGAFPVAGGLSRSVVNFNAGAVTPIASLMTAIGIAVIAGFIAPLLYWLPKVILAALIIVAVAPLIEVRLLKETWRFSRPDFWVALITFLLTLFAGVEVGVTCGVLASLALFIEQSTAPHIAEVGRIRGTEHFRNCERYAVETLDNAIFIRIDERLFFANAQEVERKIYSAISARPKVRDVVLTASAINAIDYSALKTLERINQTLMAQQQRLHLCEIKGPVMDALAHTHFLQHLSGRVFLSQNEAFEALGKL